MRIAWVVVAVVVACKSSAGEQTFAQAMKIMCEAPADPAEARAYLNRHLTNAEAIGTLSTLADFSPPERVSRLRGALERAGITTCPALVAAESKVVEHVPVVTAPGLADFDRGTTMVMITPTALIADGRTIIALDRGYAPAAELEGGADGMLVVRFGNFMKGMAGSEKHRGLPLQPIALVVDATVPYRTLLSVMFSAGKAGYARFALVVRTGDAAKQLALELPTPAPAGRPQPAGPRMVVTIGKGKLSLWSVGGDEGTLAKPKLETAQPAELQPVLAELVARRWHGGARDDDERSIVVTGEADVTVQRLAEVVAAVRAAPDGKELFPRVLLTTGF